MRKNKIWILAVVGLLILALAAPAAFGAGNDDTQKQQNQQFLDQMLKYHRDRIDQAQSNGNITPEQAQAWREHLTYMRNFHAENGFCMEGTGMMGGGMMGKGMMGGYGPRS